MNKIFKISLLIYPTTFAMALFCGTFIGIDSGWAMPAMSNHEIKYGWDAIFSYLVTKLIEKLKSKLNAGF